MAGCGKAVVNWVVSWGWTLVSAPLVVGVVYLCKNPLSKCCCECCALCQAWWWALSKCSQTLTSSQQTHSWRPISLYIIPKKCMEFWEFLVLVSLILLPPSLRCTVSLTSVAMSWATGEYWWALIHFEFKQDQSKQSQGMGYLIHHCIAIWILLMRSHSTPDQFPESFYESSIKYLHMK